MPKTINLITSEDGITEKIKLELDKLILSKNDIILVTLKNEDKAPISKVNGFIELLKEQLSKLNLDNLIIFRIGGDVDFSTISLDEMNKHGWYRKHQLMFEDK